MPSKAANPPEMFDTLLYWLDPDRDEAGKKYEVVRLGLIRMFTTRGCVDPEHLADLTIDRAATKVPEIIDTYVGNPAHYFRGVANNIFLEYLKARREDASDLDPAMLVTESYGAEYQCLRACLDGLPEPQRHLILDYHVHDRTAKIETRRVMAAELGIETNTLRLRAHRIRVILEECVNKCLEVIKG